MVSDRLGRRIAIMIPALLTIPITPLYLMTGDYTMIVVFFTIQGAFGGGGMHVLYPAYLAERFPTEVRATASGFVYHQGAIFGGLTAPVITYFAINWHLGVRCPDGGRHYSRLHQRRPGGIRRPGNSRQATRRRALSRLIARCDYEPRTPDRSVLRYDAGYTVKAK